LIKNGRFEMETARNQEQGAGRIAAALSASLKALSDLQESQRRIEERYKKSSDQLARYEKLWSKIKDTQNKQYGIMKTNKVNLVSHLEGINQSLRSINQKSAGIEKRLNAKEVERDLFWGFLPKKWVLWVVILTFGILFGRAWGFKVQRDDMADWHRGNIELFGPHDK
jgi:hypothetical protein